MYRSPKYSFNKRFLRYSFYGKYIFSNTFNFNLFIEWYLYGLNKLFLNNSYVFITINNIDYMIFLNLTCELWSIRWSLLTARVYVRVKVAYISAFWIHDFALNMHFFNCVYKTWYLVIWLGVLYFSRKKFLYRWLHD